MLRASAAERNAPHIAEILREYFKEGDKVLELASGTGQHVALLAQRFPNVTFQPSEKDPRMIHSIVAHVDHYRWSNVRVPLYIDVCIPASRWALPSEFSPGQIDAILTVNLFHISSSAAVEGVFRSAGQILRPPSGHLLVYGPFAKNGVISPESNVQFDRSLREQNSDWGLRDTWTLRELAAENGLRLVKEHPMPANNYILVFGFA